MVWNWHKLENKLNWRVPSFKASDLLKNLWNIRELIFMMQFLCYCIPKPSRYNQTWSIFEWSFWKQKQSRLSVPGTRIPGFDSSLVRQEPTIKSIINCLCFLLMGVLHPDLGRQNGWSSNLPKHVICDRRQWVTLHLWWQCAHLNELWVITQFTNEHESSQTEMQIMNDNSALQGRSFLEFGIQSTRQTCKCNPTWSEWILKLHSTLHKLTQSDWLWCITSEMPERQSRRIETEERIILSHRTWMGTWHF
jgi:hypothetical protein